MIIKEKNCERLNKYFELHVSIAKDPSMNGLSYTASLHEDISQDGWSI